MLVPIEIDNGLTPSPVEMVQLSFRDLKLKEEHLETFVRDNIELLVEDETLLIVGQQIRNQERGRSDLVALDQEGNLVLVEIKRDLEDIRGRREPFEFQAIRYAANYSNMKTIDELIELVFAPYIQRNPDKFPDKGLTPIEYGRRIIMMFLKEKNAERTFNRKQRIFLVAADFDPQTLSACAWLVSNQVDISCFKLIPYKLDTHHVLHIEQILPLPSLDGLYVNVAESRSARIKESGLKKNRTLLPRMDKLFEWGIVQKGDELTIRGQDGSNAIVLSEQEVEYNGARYKFNKWGQQVTGWSSICIYEWAYSKRLNKTLDAARKDMLQEAQLQGGDDEADME